MKKIGGHAGLIAALGFFVGGVQREQPSKASSLYILMQPLRRFPRSAAKLRQKLRSQRNSEPVFCVTYTDSFVLSQRSNL